MRLTIESDKPARRALSDLTSALGSLDYHLGHMGDNLNRETSDVKVTQDGEDLVVVVRLTPKAETTNGRTRIAEVAAVRQSNPTDPTDLLTVEG